MFKKILYLAVISFCFTVYSDGQLSAALQNPIAGKAVISIQTETVINYINNDVEAGKVYKVAVSVMFKNTYCGGAAPSQSILDQYKTEYPLTNTTIALQDTCGYGKIIKIRTNSKGVIKTKLRAGTYNYFMTKKYNKTLGFDFTSSCDEWLKRSFGQITIVAGQKDGYKILFDYGCNPCAPNRP
jgi:hypothetical protein